MNRHTSFKCSLYKPLRHGGCPRMTMHTNAAIDALVELQCSNDVAQGVELLDRVSIGRLLKEPPGESDYH